MIKAKITIFDDKTGMTFVEDRIITPSHDYRFTSLVKCYEFKFRLNVYEPFFGDDRDFLTQEEINDLQ